MFKTVWLTVLFVLAVGAVTFLLQKLPLPEWAAVAGNLAALVLMSWAVVSGRVVVTRRDDAEVAAQARADLAIIDSALERRPDLAVLPTRSARVHALIDGPAASRLPPRHNRLRGVL